jgi:hypothetical protein
MSRHAHQEPNVLHLKRLGIDTYREPVIYMTADCPVCRSEGWTAESRIQVSHNGRSIISVRVTASWSRSAIRSVVRDIVDGLYSAIEHRARGVRHGIRGRFGAAPIPSPRTDSRS